MEPSSTPVDARSRPCPPRPGRGPVRQTVELLVLAGPVRAPGPDVLGRSLRGADRLDGADAPGLASRAGLPELRVAVRASGSTRKGRPGRRSARIAASANLDPVPAIECGGDRVLVQKFLYDFRRPKRWEVAVFHFPGEPSQAYVKRVVGLPGESIRIIDGDVYVDGRIVRKSLEDQRAMRILVHDSRFEPRDSGRFPRWVFRSGWGYRSRATGWSRTVQRLRAPIPLGCRAAATG